MQFFHPPIFHSISPLSAFILPEESKKSVTQKSVSKFGGKWNAYGRIEVTAVPTVA
jgi:hypothetical protein